MSNNSVTLMSNKIITAPPPKTMVVPTTPTSNVPLPSELYRRIRRLADGGTPTPQGDEGQGAMVPTPSDIATAFLTANDMLMLRGAAEENNESVGRRSKKAQQQPTGAVEDEEGVVGRLAGLPYGREEETEVQQANLSPPTSSPSPSPRQCLFEVGIHYYDLTQGLVDRVGRSVLNGVTGLSSSDDDASEDDECLPSLRPSQLCNGPDEAEEIEKEGPQAAKSSRTAAHHQTIGDVLINHCNAKIFPNYQTIRNEHDLPTAEHLRGEGSSSSSPSPLGMTEQAVNKSRPFIHRRYSVLHSAIVAYGFEYFFEGGIAKAVKAKTRFGTYFRYKRLGYTLKTQAQFEAWLRYVERVKYDLSTYRATTYNCHTFVNEAALFLLAVRCSLGRRTELAIGKNSQTIQASLANERTATATGAADGSDTTADGSDTTAADILSLLGAVAHKNSGGAPLPELAFLFRNTQRLVACPIVKMFIPINTRMNNGTLYRVSIPIVKHNAERHDATRRIAHCRELTGVSMMPPRMLFLYGIAPEASLLDDCHHCCDDVEDKADRAHTTAAVVDGLLSRRLHLVEATILKVLCDIDMASLLEQQEAYVAKERRRRERARARRRMREKQQQQQMRNVWDSTDSDASDDEEEEDESDEDPSASLYPAYPYIPSLEEVEAVLGTAKAVANGDEVLDNTAAIITVRLITRLMTQQTPSAAALSSIQHHLKKKSKQQQPSHLNHFALLDRPFDMLPFLDALRLLALHKTIAAMLVYESPLSHFLYHKVGGELYHSGDLSLKGKIAFLRLLCNMAASVQGAAWLVDPRRVGQWVALAATALLEGEEKRQSEEAMSAAAALLEGNPPYFPSNVNNVASDHPLPRAQRKRNAMERRATRTIAELGASLLHNLAVLLVTCNRGGIADDFENTNGYSHVVGRIITVLLYNLHSVHHSNKVVLKLLMGLTHLCAQGDAIAFFACNHEFGVDIDAIIETRCPQQPPPSSSAAPPKRRPSRGGGGEGGGRPGTPFATSGAAAAAGMNTAREVFPPDSSSDSSSSSSDFDSDDDTDEEEDGSYGRPLPSSSSSSAAAARAASLPPPSSTYNMTSNEEMRSLCCLLSGFYVMADLQSEGVDVLGGGGGKAPDADNRTDVDVGGASGNTDSNPAPSQQSAAGPPLPLLAPDDITDVVATGGSFGRMVCEANTEEGDGNAPF